MKSFDLDKSLQENVKEQIMTSGAILNSEIEFLLREEFRDVTTYNVIIQAIASGSTTLSEITNKALLKNTGTTYAYLKALLDVGLIEKEFPVNIALKEQGNANRVYYKLTDDFFQILVLFYRT